MSYGWTTPIERKMFKRFPTVVFCDTTFDTNKDGRPLLLLIGKDSNSKAFTILRALLPNQQKWIFRWVFVSYYLPSMIKMHYQESDYSLPMDYCFYQLSELFHLGKYTNAPVEGDNTGIKDKSTLTVNPQMETFDTTRIRTLNGIRKERNRAAKNSRSSASTKSYSKHNFANELVNHAEVHIEDQIMLSLNYINLCITGNKWIVTKDYKNHPPKKLI